MWLAKSKKLAGSRQAGLHLPGMNGGVEPDRHSCPPMSAVDDRQEGLAASTVIKKTYKISMEVVTDYTGIGKIQYIAGEQKLPILDSEYTDRVVLHLLVPADQIAFVEKAITEGTNGRAKMKKEKDLYYSVIDGEVKVFTD